MTSLRLRAFAKINLNLKVLGLRPDGYHEIDSVAQTVTLHDSLELTLGGEGLRLEVDDPAVPAGPQNLVWQAVERIAPPMGPGRGLSLRLIKRIPSGAGLGGGSSDAAATLLGVNRLFDMRLAEEMLHTHAAALGSDVPFFLVGGTARLLGTGTDVRPLPDLPPAAILLVHPKEAPLSTRAIYAQLQEPLTLAPEPDSIPRFGRIPADLQSWVRSGNDLEPHATRLCPAVARIRTALTAAGAEAAAMSGSGSAVFGLFADADRAAFAARSMEDAGFQAFPCGTLDRSSFLRDRMVG